jgi:hypothetical protein
MRSSADVYIHIDIEKAIKGQAPIEMIDHEQVRDYLDGFEFFVSSNNVILCPGDEHGCLPATYFRAVENRQRQSLLTTTVDT